MGVLTRRQMEIFNFLRDNYESFAYPPSLDELLRDAWHGFTRVFIQAHHGFD